MRAQFLLGTPLNAADLLRARTDVAAMCIVLSPRHAPNPRAADVETLLRYLSVRRHFPDLRMAVQLLGSEDIKLVSPYDPVLSATDYKVAHVKKRRAHRYAHSLAQMGLLGTSTRAPGFSTFLSNLLRTGTRTLFPLCLCACVALILFSAQMVSRRTPPRRGIRSTSTAPALRSTVRSSAQRFRATRFSRLCAPCECRPLLAFYSIARQLTHAAGTTCLASSSLPFGRVWRLR